MSLKKSALRRLSLLAGASLAAAAAAPAFAADTTVLIGETTTQTTVVTASPTAPDTFTLNILGILRRGASADAIPNGVAVQGTGSGSVIINNGGRLQGRLDFTTATGPITLNVTTGAEPLTEGWHSNGVSTLGSGNDLVNIAVGGAIAGVAPSDIVSIVQGVSATINFGAGDDRFVNAGWLITDAFIEQATFTLANLETFENSGLIVMGSKFRLPADFGNVSDLGADDRLDAQGADFTGSGASRILMDVKLAAITQLGCPAQPVAADCVDFTGGTTAGSTVLTIRDATGHDDDAALNEGVTLIAGSSAAGHFTLDPNSDYYAQTSRGPALQKKLVAYRFVYDDAADRHLLIGALADEAFQPATFAASALETWRSTTGGWFTRQADLRATPGGLEDSAGLWARVGANVGERETTASYVQGATTYDYDLGHKQKDAFLVFGADMLRLKSANAAGVAGVMVGFVRSDVQFDASPTETVTTGFTGGFYSSYVAGPLFVDGVFNVNLLHLQAEAPNMHLGLGVPLKQDIQSVGAQLETGYRIDMGGGVSIEPLAGFSYATTRFDDLAIPGGGGGYDFDDKYTSARVGAGLRLGVDSQLMGMTSSYSLTGRYWEEMEGENAAAVTVANGAVTTPLMDDMSGAFSEIAASLSLYGAGGDVSGFVNLGGRFADGYRSVDGSVGVRLRW